MRRAAILTGPNRVENSTTCADRRISWSSTKIQRYLRCCLIARNSYFLLILEKSRKIACCFFVTFS